MEIRAATAKDCQGAYAVQHAVVPGGYPYEYSGNILCSGTVNLVAVHDGSVVGFISVLLDGLNPNGRNLWERLRPYLAFIGVLPEWQGQHVGTELIRSALQIIVPRFATDMWLECPERAAAFYKKAGFVRVAPETVQQFTGLDPKGRVYCLTCDPVAG